MPAGPDPRGPDGPIVRSVFRLEQSAVTHAGAVREVNEDNILAKDPCFVVADGIGGATAGAMASSLVVEEFALLALQRTITPRDVAATLDVAHERVRRLQALNGGRQSGSTVCGAVAIDAPGGPQWALFNIGDTRIYRVEPDGGELQQVTVDHSRVQELIDAGVITPAEAESHPERHVVTRAVGAAESYRPDHWTVPMVAGERLLLCSDGLLTSASFAQLQEVATRRVSPRQVVDELLRLALAAKAQDNVSIMVVDVDANKKRVDA